MAAAELNLPELPENYRWRIEKIELDPIYEAVTVYLERLIQHWWGDNWRPLQSQLVRRTVNQGMLLETVERRAQEMYNLEFDKTDAGRIAGIYGND